VDDLRHQERQSITSVCEGALVLPDADTITNPMRTPIEAQHCIAKGAPSDGLLRRAARRHAAASTNLPSDVRELLSLVGSGAAADVVAGTLSFGRGRLLDIAMAVA
jgi:ABC-type branched-subunit amino acid transport system ATPase component